MKPSVIANALFAALLAACSSSSQRPPAEVVPPVATVGDEQPAQPAPPQKGIEVGDLDRKIDPCSDFYEFANGTWRAQNPIPAGKPRWSRRGVERDANRKKVAALIAEASARTDWPAASAEQIVGDYYASCMDEAAAEAAGAQPIAPLLKKINEASSRADILGAIRRLHDVGVAAPFGQTAAFDNNEPMAFRLGFIGGGLGLPDRDAYLKTDQAAVKLREAYRLHISKMLALAGTPQKAALAAADGIIAIEKRLATASLAPAAAADPAATTNKTSFAQLKELAPSFDWDKYFDEAMVPREPVNVAEPKLLKQVDKELTSTPVAIWKAYLTWHVLRTAAPWLSGPFASEAFDFYGKTLGGAAEPAPRAQRCWESAEALFPEPVGKLFADRYFPPTSKAKAREISNNLLAVMREHVAALSWMAPETKKKAIEKIETMNVQIGYPDNWKDTSTLGIARGAVWPNIARARAYNVQDARRQAGKATDRGAWGLPPSSSGAYLDAQLNELVLPAGFLQPPYFNPDATDAVNYGALGAGLAHDMTHAFDATGSVLDVAGRAQLWWTAADQREFDKRAQCIIDQYDAYEVEPGVRHQGKLVLPEALGDQAGLTFAMMALKKSMAARPVPVVDGFSPEQQFFLAWAQFRGEAMRIEVQREIVKSDTHPTPKFRVNGPMVSLPAFAQAFSCKEGAPMARPAAQRCAVW